VRGPLIVFFFADIGNYHWYFPTNHALKFFVKEMLTVDNLTKSCSLNSNNITNIYDYEKKIETMRHRSTIQPISGKYDF
jgi:hypothetical protein